MKLVTFYSGINLNVGILSGDDIIDLTEAGIANSMLEFIAGGTNSLKRAHAALQDHTSPRSVLKDTRLAAPIPRPGKVLCSGINYRSHANENPKAKMPTEPFFFAKMPSVVIGHNDIIPFPNQTQELDYEIEFTAVIGKYLSNASEQEVMPGIFGYTLLHDVSARDVQFKDNQITLGKNFNGFCPMGPCIVTSDELTRPEATALQTRLNGTIMQNGTTADWLFSLPRLISFLSHVMALEPGDCISTGTPAGVGLFRNPPVFMKPGDTVEIEAAGIGILRNTIGPV